MAQEDVNDSMDQFSAREACTVLAALRVFQQIRASGGRIPPDLLNPVEPYAFTGDGIIEDLEHFEDATPLSDSEINLLVDRIEINWAAEVGN